MRIVLRYVRGVNKHIGKFRRRGTQTDFGSPILFAIYSAVVWLRFFLFCSVCLFSYSLFCVLALFLLYSTILLFSCTRVHAILLRMQCHRRSASWRAARYNTCGHPGTVATAHRRVADGVCKISRRHVTNITATEQQCRNK